MRTIRLDFRKSEVVDPPKEKKGKVRSTGDWVPRGVSRKNPGASVFWPDHEMQVKMIAMRGFTDDEIAESLGVSKELFSDWRRNYPSFDSAIESGRTQADGEVLYALYKRATGNCPVPYTEVIKYRDTFETLDMEKHFPPDTEAAKTWMRMRQKEHWRDTNASPNEARNTLGKPRESKSELISAIIGMISPKSDEPVKR